MDKNEVFENYQFIMVKRLLIVLCIWPYQNKTLKFCGRTCVIFAVFTTLLIPEMVKFFEELYKGDRDLQIITEKFSGFLYFQIVLSKLGMSTYTAKKLQHLYESITKDYNKIQEPREKTAMDGLRGFARISTIIYASYMFTVLFFCVFTPQVVPGIWTLNESRHNVICYYTEYFVDQDEYLYILVFHIFAITLTIIVAVDTSFIAVTYRVLKLFSVLNWHFKWLSNWMGSNVNREEQRLHNFMIHIIKIHKRTLKFAKFVRSTYDVHSFVIFGLSLLSRSFGSIEVMLNLTKPEVIMRIGFVFVGVILYLFLMNWPDQRFLDGSDDLAGSIYSCNWYNLSTRAQFFMRYMMMRCLISCQLTAGLLFQMNFAVCGSILRKSISFFMGVYSLN